MKHRVAVHVLAALLLAITVGPAMAQRPQPGKIPVEGPSPVTAPQFNVLPFRAVGLLRIASGKCTTGQPRRCFASWFNGCTVTAIAPRVVLTAAHCFFDEEPQADGSVTRTPRPATAFRVEMGHRGEMIAGTDGTRIAAANVVRYHVPESYAAARPTRDEFGSTAAWSDDWGVAFLDADVVLPNEALQIRAFTPAELTERIARGQTIMQIGYGFSLTTLRGPPRLHAIRDCRIARHWNALTYGHFCGTVPGDSGSANLIEEQGRFWIVGVESRDTKAYLQIGIVTAAAAFADYATRAAAGRAP